MKKFTQLFILALIAVFAFSGIAVAKQQRFEAMVYKADRTRGAGIQITEANKRTTGITYKVLVHDSDTAETILGAIGPTGKAVTAKTNPVTTTVFATDGGRISFVCDPSETGDTYVDLIVVDTVGGYSSFVQHFSANEHVVVIDETPGIMHHGMVWFSGTTITETSTGIYFIGDTLIHDVQVEVVGVSASQTLDVGIKNVDPNGLRVGVLLTTAGYIADTGVVTTATYYTYYPASTYGALLKTAITGTGSTFHGGATNLNYVLTSAVTAGDFLTYTNSGATATGYLHYWFTKMR